MGDCGPFVFAVWCARCREARPEQDGFPEGKDGEYGWEQREYLTYRWAVEKARRHALATGHEHATVASL